MARYQINADGTRNWLNACDNGDQSAREFTDTAAYCVMEGHAAGLAGIESRYSPYTSDSAEDDAWLIGWGAAQSADVAAAVMRLVTVKPSYDFLADFAPHLFFAAAPGGTFEITDVPRGWRL